MILNETFYRSDGYTHGFRDDEITRAVARYVEEEENIAFLEYANELGIPPCLAFILISAPEKRGLFSKYLQADGDKQYFGTLFGAVFRSIGYEVAMEKPMFLKNASTFRRIKNEEDLFVSCMLMRNGAKLLRSIQQHGTGPF